MKSFSFYLQKIKGMIKLNDDTYCQFEGYMEPIESSVEYADVTVDGSIGFTRAIKINDYKITFVQNPNWVTKLLELEEANKMLNDKLRAIRRQTDE